MNDATRGPPIDPAADPPGRLGVTRDDLAPADFRSADFDWTGYDVAVVGSADDANFRRGYAALWEEFGAKNELETEAVLKQRLGWRPESPRGDTALRYEMIVVYHDGALAAVRDHTAVVDLRRSDRPVVVHLSHLLIAPRWRGNGLAGWLRALPLRTARECLRRAGQPARPVTLVAEMEPADANEPGRFGRLIAYEKVGFRKIDPRRVNYLQPDFRPPAVIDAAGGPTPLPLSLVVRRIGREAELTMGGSEARLTVEALYTMYAESFRPQDMRPCRDSLTDYPADDATIDLVRPSAIRTRLSL